MKGSGKPKAAAGTTTNKMKSSTGGNAQGKRNGATASSHKSSAGGGQSKASKPSSSTSTPAVAGKTTPKKKRTENEALPSPAFSFSSPSPHKSHTTPSSRSPMPFVFSASTSMHASPSSSPSSGVKFSPSPSPSMSGPSSFAPSPSSSPFKRGGGRGRGGYGGGGGDGGFEGGGGRGRGGGSSPYQPKSGYKPLGNSGGQHRFKKERERVLGQWSDAVNYDRVKRVINIYLNEFQLKDRDLERFIEWFETNDGSRRSLGWLLERHHNGWDEDSANVDGSGNVDNNTGDRRSETAKRKHHDSETPAKKDGKPPGMNWHLQENQITDEGVKLLIAFAKRIDSKVELRRFYLYKNIIGDEGAAAIASFVKESCNFVYEIHLSHNRLTIKGAEALFTAVKEAKVKPPRPLWLRLEWNYISFPKAKKLLQDQGISYCRVKDRAHCAPSKCARKPPPLLHLYVAELQYSESVGASSRLQLAKERVKLAKERVEKLTLENDAVAFGSEKREAAPSSSAAAPTTAVAAGEAIQPPSTSTSEKREKAVEPATDDADETPAAKAKAKTGPSAAESVGGGERKEAATKSAAARTPSRKNENDADPAAMATTSTPAKKASESDEDLLKDVPTYIFLDTCAVLRMCESRKGSKGIEAEMAQHRKAVDEEDDEDEDEYADVDFDEEDEGLAAEDVMKIVQRKVDRLNQQKTKTKKSIVQLKREQQQQQMKSQAANNNNNKGKAKTIGGNVGRNAGGMRDGDTAEFPVFTFDNLVERARKGKFGENLTNPGDQVTLVITDTVMRELDHLKSSKPALIRHILSLQSDDGYLAKGVHLKFVEMLGAHQGEHLVALQDSSIVQSYGRKVMKGTSSLDNDRKIIDVALFWNSEMGVTGNVILLTADEGVREAAKRHNLPSDLWKNLDKRLFNALKNDPSAPWTSSLLKSCMPGCMVKRDGKTMHLTPSVKPVQSIFQELDNALVLTYMLMEKVRSLEADNRRLKDFVFGEIKSRAAAIDPTDVRTGLADLQAAIAQHQRERGDEGDEYDEDKDEGDEGDEGDEEEVGSDESESDRLIEATRERRRVWLEMLGQMAGPMSPLRMKSAESIWDGVKRTSRGAAGGAGLSQLMKTAEFLEVEDDSESEEEEIEPEEIPENQDNNGVEEEREGEGEGEDEGDDEDDDEDDDEEEVEKHENVIAKEDEAVAKEEEAAVGSGVVEDGAVADTEDARKAEGDEKAVEEEKPAEPEEEKAEETKEQSAKEEEKVATVEAKEEKKPDEEGVKEKTVEVAEAEAEVEKVAVKNETAVEPKSAEEEGKQEDPQKGTSD